jgi:hypothetical protein
MSDQMKPKHTFIWPRSWYLRDQPHGCVTISFGTPGKVGSWFRGQRHAVRILECGCAVCIFCGNLLMFDARKKGMGWWVFKNDWLQLPLQIEAGQRLAEKAGAP